MLPWASVEPIPGCSVEAACGDGIGHIRDGRKQTDLYDRMDNMIGLASGREEERLGTYFLDEGCEIQETLDA